MVDRRNPPPSVDIAPDRMATPMNPVQDLNCCKTSAGWQAPGTISARIATSTGRAAWISQPFPSSAGSRSLPGENFHP